MAEQSFIPFHLPSLDESESREVLEALASGWVTTGPKTTQFEREFREYVRAPFAQALNSGTAALHLALAALGVGPGDEVITTPLTFCATVNVILQVGATPVLADVGPDGNIDPESIMARTTPRTRAIIPVHLGGLPCRMLEIWRWARSRGLHVVEDAAHALSAHYDGHPIGAGHPDQGFFSDAVCFSFYATKNLTTGEGGMVTTHRAELQDEIRLLTLHGISRDAWNRYSAEGSWRYEVVRCGFKYNISDILSAVGIAQLRKQEEFCRMRTLHAATYCAAFSDMPELEPPSPSPGTRHCWHLYMLRLNLERLDINRAQFIEQLKKRGIGCSVHFIPIPLHPVFADLKAHDCPRAMATYERLVSLPLYPSLKPEQVQRVVDSVKDVVQANRKRRMVGSAAV